MNVLVTGGAGFVGSHVVDACVAAGHRVVVVDDLSTGRADQVHPAATLVRRDVREPGLDRVLRDFAIDAVSHHAARIDLRASVRDPVGDAEVNVLGSLRVLEAARAAGVGRLVFASTGAVLGEPEAVPATEDHPTRPLSPYGAGKLAVEAYLGAARSWGLACTVLRYANVYGPRQDPHGEAGVVAIFCERMLRGEEVVIHGDGRQTRDYVFVADVVDANLRALAGPGGTFHVGTGVETDVVAIHAALAARLGVAAPPRHGPAAPGEQRRSALDPARARSVLGWTPRTPLAEGLAATADWFRARSGGR